MLKRPRTSESTAESENTLPISMLGNSYVMEYLEQLAAQNQLESFRQILVTAIIGTREFQFVARNSGKLLATLLSESKFDFLEVYIECLEQQLIQLPPAQRIKTPQIHNIIFGILIWNDKAVATFLSHYPGRVNITQRCDYKYKENECLISYTYTLLNDKPCLTLYLQQATQEQLNQLFLWALQNEGWAKKLKQILKHITNLNDCLQSLPLNLHCRCLVLLLEHQMSNEFIQAHTVLKSKYPNYQEELIRNNIFKNCKPKETINNSCNGWIESISDILIILEFLLEHDFNLFSHPGLLGKILSSLVLHDEFHSLIGKFIAKVLKANPFNESQWKSFEKNLRWDLILNNASFISGWRKNVELLFTLHPYHQKMVSENTLTEHIIYSVLNAISNKVNTPCFFYPTKVRGYILDIFTEFYGKENADAAILKHYFPYLLTLEADSRLDLFKQALLYLYHSKSYKITNYAFILPILKKASLISINYCQELRIGNIDLLSGHIRDVLDFFKVTLNTIAWDLIDNLVDEVQSGKRHDLTTQIILTRLNGWLKISPDPQPETQVFTKIATFKMQHQNNKESPYFLAAIEQFFLENSQCRTQMRQALNLATRTNLKKGTQLAGLHEDKQSTHGTGVHKSCAETAKKLWDAYFVKPFAENEREAEVNKAIEELFDFYYKKALESTKPLYAPVAQQIYNDSNGWSFQSWGSLSEKQKSGYLYITTYLLSSKLGDRSLTLYPRMDNKIYWLDKNFTAHRFLTYCRHYYLNQVESISQLKFKQILASLWRAIEDKSALAVDYQQRVKEKLFRDLLCSLAREYNTSIYHTIYLVDSLPGPEILTRNIKFANAIYITPDGTVFFVANTKITILKIPSEIAVCVFTSGQKLTNFNEPISQQYHLPENIINPFWNSLEKLNICRYSADIPTCFGGAVNSSLSLLDEQHPLVFTDQVTTTRIINFIVDFYEPKFEKLPSDEKDFFAEYILKEETLPKPFVDRYVDDFYLLMKPHVDRGALTQKDIECWFAGEELPVSLFKEIQEYCKSKKNTIASPRQQLSLFQLGQDNQVDQQTNLPRGFYG